MTNQPEDVRLVADFETLQPVLYGMHNASRYLQRVLETAGLTESLPHIDLPRPVGIWEVVNPSKKEGPILTRSGMPMLLVKEPVFLNSLMLLTF
jgi:hypothetical protein